MSRCRDMDYPLNNGITEVFEASDLFKNQLESEKESDDYEGEKSYTQIKEEKVMRVTLTNNVLTVVTDIAKETIESGLAKLVALEDGNEVYGVSVATDGKASFNAFSFVGNTYVDGKLAATIILPMAMTMDEVKKTHGENLLKAKRYTAQIAEAAAAKAAEIRALFE